MPAAVALPALLSLAAAYLVEGQRPEMPAGGSEFGLDDADLWVRIDNGGDVLSGMMFAEAVNQDPRRIYALIQQRVLNEFYRVLGMTLAEAKGRSEEYQNLARHSYIDGMNELRLRGEGKITARILADEQIVDWEEKGALILAIWQMRQEEAEVIRNATREHRNEIYRAFREAAQIAKWASRLAARGEDQAAWADLVGVYENMRDFVQRGMEALGLDLTIEEGEIPLEHLLPGYEESAAIPVGEREEVKGMFGTDFESFRPAGQRGSGISRGQWRRAGGRYY